MDKVQLRTYPKIRKEDNFEVFAVLRTRKHLKITPSPIFSG